MLLSEQLKQAKPYFAEQKLEALTPELIDIVNQFASSVYWIDSTSVAVGDVVGTIHPDYQGKSWEWLLNNGRRMSHNLELLNNNSKYYLETIKKEPSMYYIKINDKLYVGADGNHRTCIAKYLSDIQCNTLIYGITLDEYIVDFSLIAAYKDLIEFVKSKRLSTRLILVRKIFFPNIVRSLTLLHSSLLKMRSWMMSNLRRQWKQMRQWKMSLRSAKRNGVVPRRRIGFVRKRKRKPAVAMRKRLAAVRKKQRQKREKILSDRICNRQFQNKSAPASKLAGGAFLLTGDVHRKVLNKEFHCQSRGAVGHGNDGFMLHHYLRGKYTRHS